MALVAYMVALQLLWKLLQVPQAATMEDILSCLWEQVALLEWHLGGLEESRLLRVSVGKERLQVQAKEAVAGRLSEKEVGVHGERGILSLRSTFFPYKGGNVQYCSIFPSCMKNSASEPLPCCPSCCHNCKGLLVISVVFSVCLLIFCLLCMISCIFHENLGNRMNFS